MPVSGNEEAKLLARKSSDLSAGIPLKKRRFLLVPPSSPPRNESPPTLSEVSNVKSQESGSDLNHKEEVRSDCKEKEASLSEKNEGEYGQDVKDNQAAGSNLLSKVESPPDAKDKEELLSDQGPSSVIGTEKSPGKSDVANTNLREVKKEIVSGPSTDISNLHMDVSGPKVPEIKPVGECGSENRAESRTELLFLTGKTDASGASISSESAALVRVKKEMESKQTEDCSLKLSTASESDKKKFGSKESLVSGIGDQHTQSGNGKDIHASVLSLSLSKEAPILENTSCDTDGKISPANRSNWDLNTTVDAWEGSIGDAAFQCHVDGPTKKTDSNQGRLSSGSIPLINVLSGKGKQVISTSEPRLSLPTSSMQLVEQSEDSLRLTLSPSFQGEAFDRVPSDLSTNIAYSRKVTNLHSTFEESSTNKNASVFRVVKPEPSEERPNYTGTSGSSTELLDVNSLKGSTFENHNNQALKLAASSSQNSSEQKSIKPEPRSEVCGTADLTLQPSIGKFVHSQESGSSSSMLTMPVTPPNPSSTRLPASSEMSMSVDISNQSEHSVHTKEFHLGNDVLVQSTADVNPNPVHFGGRDETLADTDLGNRTLEAKNVDEAEVVRVKEHLDDLPTTGERCASDEEKISISGEIMEDESYGSDYESDSNQALGNQLDKQTRCLRDDEEYEDGEVRESQLQLKTENPAANEIEAENAKYVCDNNDSSPCFHDDTEEHQGDDNDNVMKNHDNPAVGDISETAGFISNGKSDQLPDTDGPSQNLSNGMTEDIVHEKKLGISIERESVDNSGDRSSVESIDKDLPRDAANSGHRVVTATGEAKGEMIKAEQPNSSSPIVGASSNDTNAAKDPNRGGNRSRIIKLPRASATSPCKTNSVPDKLLSSRSGRERYSEYEGEKFFLRGNRDEMDTDGSHRFARERIQDHSFRNSRLNYTRGRGRFSGRLGTSRSEWGSDRDFALGSYNDDYRFTRNKRAAGIAETELDCDDYVNAPPDGVNLSAGRGRKSLNDDLPSFRHPSSRRFSPGGRDGAAARGGVEIHRRLPRNISPGRRNDENISLVGLRHDDKFARVLSDDIIDHAYTRPHTVYEGGGDGQFIRGNRNLPAFQRRGFPLSKSPVGSRTRSPGPWSSPRRRSPDGFNGLAQLAQHRSAGMFGMERMRSPDRSCFPEQMIARRRSSPSYMGRPCTDSRDVDASGREHGHPRPPPINTSRRSPPPERVFNRNRRLDDLDPRIRASNEEYFGRPVHSGRFHEFHADASSDERRKCGERRGMTRPFRPPPPYIGESDNAHPRFHSDDGTRPLRFCSEADQEFPGRGMRERDFDGRMKGRQMVAPRRIRSIDDEEGSYRHAAGQVWHDDDAFHEGGGSGFKRRRF